MRESISRTGETRQAYFQSNFPIKKSIGTSAARRGHTNKRRGHPPGRTNPRIDKANPTKAKNKPPTANEQPIGQAIERGSRHISHPIPTLIHA
jgi:hypothetical protein